MTSPLVSVLLPVRNGEPYFAAALDSILSQQDCDFEVIVVDDGSTDGTPALLAACADPRLQVVRGGGLGVGGAIIAAVDHARGEFLARMDADDIALPGRLASQAALLQHHPDAALVHCSARIIDADGRVIGTQPARQLDPVAQRGVLLNEQDGLPIVHPGVMIRRALLERAGGYRPLPAAQDHELWLRLIEQGRFIAMPEELLLYRRHDGAVSSGRLLQQATMNLTNCIAARYRAAQGRDLYRDDPLAYEQLGQLVADRGLPWLRAMTSGRHLRTALRAGDLRQAWTALREIIGIGAPQLAFNAMVRRKHVELQHSLLRDFEILYDNRDRPGSTVRAPQQG